MTNNTFLTAEWRKLIMAQYAVDPATLAPYLPQGTELDLYQGDCFVSVVGFLFDQVRIKGLAIPFHTRFEEVNLRFYVRRTEPCGSVRRGVVFLREFVPRAAITMIANALYEEPYATLPTRHHIMHGADTLQVRYDWRHRKTWYSLGVEASVEPQAIASGSIEDFITEHYWGFTRRRNCRTSQYEVRHPSWMTYPILRHQIDMDFGALYGTEFAALTQRRPDNILLAEGSAISVASGTRLGSG